MAHAGLRFRLSKESNVTLGYWHDFRDAFVGDINRIDAAFLRLDALVATWLDLRAGLIWTRANIRNYYLNDMVGPSCTGGGDTSLCTRKDNYVQLHLVATAYLASWLSAAVGYTLQLNRSDFEAVDISYPTPISIRTDFLRHRVYTRLTAHY